MPRRKLGFWLRFAATILRPPVSVLAGGSGWRGRRLPARVTYVPDLGTAVTLVARATGA